MSIIAANSICCITVGQRGLRRGRDAPYRLGVTGVIESPRHREETSCVSEFYKLAKASRGTWELMVENNPR